MLALGNCTAKSPPLVRLLPESLLKNPSLACWVCFYNTQDGLLLHSPAALGDPPGLYLLSLLGARPRAGLRD